MLQNYEFMRLDDVSPRFAGYPIILGVENPAVIRMAIKKFSLNTPHPISSF